MDNEKPKDSIVDILYVPNDDGDTILHTLIKDNNLPKKAEKKGKKFINEAKEKTLYIADYADSGSDAKEMFGDLKNELITEAKKIDEKNAELRVSLSATISNLIGCGGDINAKNNHGETPFHIAVKQDVDLAYTLLTTHRKAINPSIRDESIKLLPLEYAIYELKNPKITSELLYCGADVRIILQPTENKSTRARFDSLSSAMQAEVTGHLAQMYAHNRDAYYALCKELKEKNNIAKKENNIENESDSDSAEEKDGSFVTKVVIGKTMDQAIKDNKKKRKKLYGQAIENDCGQPTDSADSSDED
jgi:ankyrin repeat protein